MINLIKKTCPECKNLDSDIHAAVILTDNKGIETSYNKYTCLKCHIGFAVKRKGNKTEQELTEKYIKSSEIKLKK